MCTLFFCIVCSMWVGGRQQLWEVKIVKQFIFQTTSSQWMLWGISVKNHIGVLKPTWPLVTWMFTRLTWGEIILYSFNYYSFFLALNFAYDISFVIKWLVVLFAQNIIADMRKVLAKNPQVEQQRLHRRVFLDNINPENQALLVSAYSFIG